VTLIKDLIEIPERVQKGDFVLKLTEGVTRVEATLRDYVVTPELKDCFDNALTFIRSSLQSNSSKASYLHGSFGSGKSHFMAVLNLILQGIPEAKGIKELAPVITKHNDWITGKKFLLVPYHMIGAHDMESGILGGYVDHVRHTYPEAPIPAVYLAEGLFADAQSLRKKMGDDAFFSALSAESSNKSGWGELANQWDADRFESAIVADPGSEERSQLISALIGQFFGSYDIQAGGKGEAFLSLDQGLSVISKHAQSLGYDALILFLDELILWLASRATDLKFIHQEGQKLAKLVEAQRADRPIPIISFVARQRDLSELVGTSIPGAERLNFSDALKHWEGRFHRITLEDRNLPAIAEKRILKCKTKSARDELNAAFEQATRIREPVLNTLLTSEGDREMFRKVYPFSPALVQTLIAVSSVLQRERTALKVMMQLLVDQRETLTVGDILPVGDLFDVIAHGDEAFSEEMAIHFDNAKRLYHQKLRPELEKRHGYWDDLEKLSSDDQKRIAFRNDDRLVKTLLLSALVPEVESLRGLTADRLAALNHGTIKSPIPGREGQEVLRRCREWAANVGEIRIGEEPTNPSISVQLSGVDTDSILKQAEREDNRGNRIRLVRDILFEQLDIKGENELEQQYELQWRNTRRSCIVLFQNIRELPEPSLENSGDNWKVIIDFPFDEAGYYPSDDRTKCSKFKESHQNGAKTLCWIPSFFSEDAQKDLGTLVVLEHILTGERLTQYSSHLSPQDRQTAKSLLENQRSVLRQRVRLHLDAAYGIIDNQSTSLDTTSKLELHEQFVSLLHGFELRSPTAPNLSGALQHFLGQALEHEFPSAPNFEADVSKFSNLQKVYQVVSDATRTPDGRIEVERSLRPLMRQIANPLLLGDMGQDATHFVLGQHWKNHFIRKFAEAGGNSLRVAQIRQWIDEPKPMGLSKELQNLIILAYAEQTGRSFYRHNVPIDVLLKDIPNDCELKEEHLPDEGQWQSAVQRTNSIFKISVAPLRKAKTVAELESKVKEQAASRLEGCQNCTQLLRDRLNHLGCDTQCDRLQTATTTLTLLERLCSGKSEEVVNILASAEISTTESAMCECLHQATNLSVILDTTPWEIFESIEKLADKRQSKSIQILDDLKQALSSDEHVIALGVTLKASQGKALKLFTEESTTLPEVSASPHPSTSSKVPAPLPITTPRHAVVTTGTEENLKLKAAQDLLQRLSKDIKPGQNIRLSISWMIEEEISE
jgi:hypothetical protein